MCVCELYCGGFAPPPLVFFHVCVRVFWGLFMCVYVCVCVYAGACVDAFVCVLMSTGIFA